jgi:hypothetical protein
MRWNVPGPTHDPHVGATCHASSSTIQRRGPVLVRPLPGGARPKAGASFDSRSSTNHRASLRALGPLRDGCQSRNRSSARPRAGGPQRCTPARRPRSSSELHVPDVTDDGDRRPRVRPTPCPAASRRRRDVAAGPGERTPWRASAGQPYANSRRGWPVDADRLRLAYRGPHFAC